MRPGVVGRCGGWRIVGGGGLLEARVRREDSGVVKGGVAGCTRMKASAGIVA